jgi:hypothetical protein
VSSVSSSRLVETCWILTILETKYCMLWRALKCGGSFPSNVTARVQWLGLDAKGMRSRMQTRQWMRSRCLLHLHVQHVQENVVLKHVNHLFYIRSVNDTPQCAWDLVILRII